MKKQTITISICVINFLLAISSTIGMTIIPLLIVENYSLLILGVIEGITEFLSSSLRLISGFFFDKKENKFKLIIYPIYLAFISKIVLLNPNAITLVLTKVIERISNGAFGPLRDALILKFSAAEGKDLSLLNISKSSGCLIGPLLVSVASYFTKNITPLIFFCLLVCTFAIILAFNLSKLPIKLNKIKTESIKLKLKDINNMKQIYPIIALGCLFFLCRFNDGLIIIFLKQLGYPDWLFLATIGIFNFFMLFISPLIGKLLDKGYINFCVFFTLFSIILFNLTSYNLTSVNITLAFIILFFWGSQRVSSQMTFLFLLKQNTNKEYLGRAIGLYALLTGVCTLIASTIAGFLANISFSYIFLYSGLCGIICLLFFIVLVKTNIIKNRIILNN